MQKIVASSALVLAGLVLGTGLGMANTITLTGTNTGTQTLTGSTESFSLNPNGSTPGTLTVSGTGNVALTLNGGSGSNPATVSVTNNGTIDQTGTAYAVVDGNGHGNVTINNGSSSYSAAIIETANDDTIHFSKASTSVTLNNYGTINSQNSSAGSNQAINWDGITSGSNTLNNEAGGLIEASEADAVRPGVNGVINNAGTIKAMTSVGASSDGIEATANNGNAGNSGVVITNMGTGIIDGGRHGITGGNTDTTTTGTFTMSVTNQLGGVIKGESGSGINIDGFNGNEVVTVVNTGTITGTSTTGDSDGVDIDGLVNLNNSGTIHSLNAASTETSEGVTVGGGTIINSGTIQGTSSTGAGRGITFAGIDHDSNDNPIAVQKIYANSISATGVANSNPSGASYVTNNSGGLIKGDSDAGIAIAGSATTGTSYAVIITNNANATIEGKSSTVAVIDGSVTVGGAVSPTASTNNETVINYGTIQQDGTGAAISLGSGTNSVQILGGAASINGDISGGTSAGSNTLVIDPNSVTSGQTFSYSHALSNFNSVTLKSGTITLSGASTYTGATTVSGGTSYINNASGSGTGSGAVGVSQGATLAGNGIIQPGSGNGVTLANGGTLSSGGVQPTAGANGRSTAVVGTGLTLDNTVAKGTILDASVGGAGGANLTFALGAGTYGVNTTSTYMKVLDDGLADTANELKFAANDTITLDDLTNGALQLSVNTPYLLIQATNDADYSGLTTTGDVNGQTNQDGYVTTHLNIAGNVGGYSGLKLYLANGVLEVVPEPGNWALMLGGLAVLFTIQLRRRRSNS